MITYRSGRLARPQSVGVRKSRRAAIAWMTAAGLFVALLAPTWVSAAPVTPSAGQTDPGHSKIAPSLAKRFTHGQYQDFWRS